MNRIARTSRVPAQSRHEFDKLLRWVGFFAQVNATTIITPSLTTKKAASIQIHMEFPKASKLSSVLLCGCCCCRGSISNLNSNTQTSYSSVTKTNNGCVKRTSVKKNRFSSDNDIRHSSAFSRRTVISFVMVCLIHSFSRFVFDFFFVCMYVIPKISSNTKTFKSNTYTFTLC